MSLLNGIPGAVCLKNMILKAKLWRGREVVCKQTIRHWWELHHRNRHRQHHSVAFSLSWQKVGQLQQTDYKDPSGRVPGDVGNRLGRIESKVTPGQKLMMGRHPPPFLESKKIRFQILCVSIGNTFFSEKLPKQRSLQGFARFCWKFLKIESFGEKTISDKFERNFTRRRQVWLVFKHQFVLVRDVVS